MHRDHTATMRDIMMRMHCIHHSAHGWTLQQLTCLQQACCSLQQLERDHASRPHGYNARHHDAHALSSSQRAHISTVRPRQTRVVGGAHPKPVRKRVVTCIALHTTLHVNTAPAVRCNARAASATDLRARYLAPLARCALLPTLPRQRCTPPCTRRIRCSGLSLSLIKSFDSLTTGGAVISCITE
jgi:hypothetical protein